MLTEASQKKRASLHVVQGAAALAQFHRGGIEPLECSLAEFSAALRRENHTLKRSLADPRLLSGIGNAYSDEILFAAELSPVTLTSRLGDEQIARLYAAMQSVLSQWTERLSGEAAEKFPEKVTAFRPEMAVHGRFGKPCPRCGTLVQRIVYAENECNYCPRCQTGGKLLADRSLSRLLKDDWPRTIDEWEERQK
jgi:formamidopyrimidine-DNA glycosylase